MPGTECVFSKSWWLLVLFLLLVKCCSRGQVMLLPNIPCYVLQLLLDSLALGLKVVAIPFYAYYLVSLTKVKLGVYVYRKVICNMDTNFKSNFRNTVKKKKEAFVLRLIYTRRIPG